MLGTLQELERLEVSEPSSELTSALNALESAQPELQVIYNKRDLSARPGTDPPSDRRASNLRREPVGRILSDTPRLQGTATVTT